MKSCAKDMLIDEERWLISTVDWWGRSIDKESQLIRKVNWWGKSIDMESQLIRRVDWQGKLIGEENCLMRKVDWWRMAINEESCLMRKKVNVLLLLKLKQNDWCYYHEASVVQSWSVGGICEVDHIQYCS